MAAGRHSVRGSLAGMMVRLALRIFGLVPRTYASKVVAHHWGEANARAQL